MERCTVFLIPRFSQAVGQETTQTSQVAQWQRICLLMLELPKTQGRRVDLLEEEMAIHSSIIARITTWTQEPGRLQSMGSQRVRHD